MTTPEAKTYRIHPIGCARSAVIFSDKDKPVIEFNSHLYKVALEAEAAGYVEWSHPK